MCIVHPWGLQSPEVFTCAQAGCAACQEALLERHMGLVHAILRRQWRGNVPYADLVQEGRIGLWQAILHFDPHRHVAFSTYAWYAVARRIWHAVLLDRRQAALCLAPQPVPKQRTADVSVDPLGMAEDALWWAEVCATLTDMVMRLPDPLPEVIVACYGLDGGPACSLAAIGRRYGVTREMVRVWRNQALVQLRMPLFSTRLRTLCAQHSRAAYARAQALNRAWLGRRQRRRAR